VIQLHHNGLSTCSQKVRLVLAEKGLEWQSRHLDLWQGDQQRPPYLALNPGAVVPTLVDEGRVIIESSVIMEYLDDA
jgi:glutathione S-transferase